MVHVVGRGEVLAGVQWRRVSALVDHDFSDPDLPRAVAAGRGRVFQRLEFLGDRVLELSVATGLAHAERGGNPMAGAQLARTVAEVTDGEHLERVSMRSQLASLIGFQAGHKRRADVVEAVVGALFLDGGWATVDRFALRTGLIPDAPPVRPPAPPATTDDLPEELDRLADRPEASAVAKVVGLHTIDTTLAWWAYRTMPERDEAVLSAMVHRRGGNAALATVANRHRLTATHHRSENRLRAWVGAVALDHGRSSGVALASALLDLGLPPVDSDVPSEPSSGADARPG
jgi:dsRNA-specific ribonuclease